VIRDLIQGTGGQAPLADKRQEGNRGRQLNIFFLSLAQSGQSLQIDFLHRLASLLTVHDSLQLQLAAILNHHSIRSETSGSHIQHSFCLELAPDWSVCLGSFRAYKTPDERGAVR
jgi:hypothetical protein